MALRLDESELRTVLQKSMLFEESLCLIMRFCMLMGIIEDNIGKLINSLGDGNKHHESSSVLGRVAGEVREVIRGTYNGCLIHSDSDDFLALMLLHTVLECANELSHKFKSNLKDFIANDGALPSLSIRISVYYYIKPLKMLLQLGRWLKKRQSRFQVKMRRL